MILLIGLRGSGKTTLGRALAESLSTSFTDLDAVTLRRMGRPSVADAWCAEGEDAFREAEVEALRELISGEGGWGVIALGGGTPTASGAEPVLRETNARIVYLRGEPELLRRRLPTGDDPDRPSLTGADPLEEIERIFARRDPLYRSLAHVVIELRAHETPDDTLKRIIGAIE